MCVIVLIVGGAQDLEAMAAAIIGLGLADFFLFLVGWKKAIAQANCILSWDDQSKSCYIGSVTDVLKNVPIWN